MGHACRLISLFNDKKPIDLYKLRIYLKMEINDKILLIIGAGVSTIAALLTLIGFVTPRWLHIGPGIFKCPLGRVCSPSAATLSILALLLLITTAIILVTIAVRLFPRKCRFIPLLLIFIATIFIPSAYASYLNNYYRGSIVGYSFNLMISAQLFAYLASLLIAFWFGSTMSNKITTTTIRTTNTNVPASSKIILPS
ncbi:unnamed protein product [Didymodactylos carnosus]|uniref:Uncharacterized protein n=1 Tax=Didymodactylos carnosus TaxID=1234261 RepID=A0A813XJF3_9BILA|nr:unnamed protein product [Didymodactylos carnosus]CAF1438683.1 unnamed protein product [Didymodactylos carnosus]CAF3653617.1 unnamed protein product [Didymodactylos carnosus]CAF4235359.1 unnamed protein product [Didymodactylos carnosus]